jgi:hypothetical protein
MKPLLRKSNVDDVDYFTRQEIHEYSSMLSMGDQELDKHNQVKERFTKLLRLLIIK